MKLIFSISQLLSGLLLIFLCFLFFSFVPAEIVTGEISIIQFLADNWEVIALLVSEILALFSVKYSGILKGGVNLLGKWVKFRARKSKL